jgi:flagellar motor switch protein FliM
VESLEPQGPADNGTPAHAAATDAVAASPAASDAAAPAAAATIESLVYTAARGAGLHPFDVAGQERIVRGRMPALDAVTERMARAITPAIAAWLKRDLRLAGASVALVRHASFAGSLAATASIDVAALDPLRGSALVVCEPALVFMAIDALFGGSGKRPATLEGRTFSATELRVIDRIVALACVAFADAWQSVHPLTIAPQRRETNVERADIARGPDTVVHSRFEFELGGQRAVLHLCLPWAALEPIRDALYTPVAGDGTAQDQRWMQQLASQIQNAEVVLSARLAKAQATVRQLLALEPGDFVELELEPRVQATVEGVPMFEGAYGVANGRYALRVDRLLAGTHAHQPGVPT